MTRSMPGVKRRNPCPLTCHCLCHDTGSTAEHDGRGWCPGKDGDHPTQRVSKHVAVVDRPDSVTHFVCPTAVIDIGEPKATHHINDEGKCYFCGKSQRELRKEVGL